MRFWSPIVMVVTCSWRVVICATQVPSETPSHTPAVEGGPEELPKPSEFRYTPLKGSYNPFEVYESLDTIRKSSYPSKHQVRYKESRLPAPGDMEAENILYDETDVDRNYDSHPSASGYGHHCDSVNPSAVALLALLFLLNLVQDIIEQVTAGNNRRKRDIESDDSLPLQFLYDGGLDALKEGLPDNLIPLVVKMSETSSYECILRPICDSNRDLSTKYGSLGRVFGTLSTNVFSSAFFSAPSAVRGVKEAAFHGRNKESCHIFEYCSERQH